MATHVVVCFVSPSASESSFPFRESSSGLLVLLEGEVGVWIFKPRIRVSNSGLSAANNAMPSSTLIQ